MAKKSLVCNVLSAGMQKGTLRFFNVTISPVKSAEVSEADPGIETERFQKHLERIGEEIVADIEHLEQKAKKEEAEIMRAHVAILQDSSFHERIRQAIQEMKYFTEDAVVHVTGELADLFSQ